MKLPALSLAQSLFGLKQEVKLQIFWEVSKPNAGLFSIVIVINSIEIFFDTDPNSNISQSLFWTTR